MNRLLKWLTATFRPGQNNNWKVVALCFIGAATFWFFNALNKQYNASLSYPIRFEFENQGLIITQPLPDEVVLELQGGGWDMLRKTFWLTTQPVVIPLEDPEGTEYITNNEILAFIGNSFGDITIDAVKTDTLFLHIERNVQRAQYVRPDTSALTFESPYFLPNGPVIISPDSILYTGPASALDTLADTLVLTLPGRNIDETYDREVKIPYSGSEFVSLNPEQVQVYFTVMQYALDSNRVPLTLLNFPEEAPFTLADSTAMVTFWHPANTSSLTSAAGIKVVLHYDSLNTADSTLRPYVDSVGTLLRNVQLDTGAIKLLYE